MSQEIFRRADVVIDHQRKNKVRVVEEKGSKPTPLDFRLVRHAQRARWFLNRSDLKVYTRRCLNCGRVITQKRRQKFCCDACRYTYNQRKYRARKRMSKLNKPVMGVYGELHIYFTFKGHPLHTIIPSFYARNQAMAIRYVLEHYEGEIKETVMAQVVRYYGRENTQ